MRKQRPPSDTINIPIRQADENTSPDRNPCDEKKTKKRKDLEKRAFEELKTDHQHMPPAVVRTTDAKINFWQPSGTSDGGKLTLIFDCDS
jgi:hypothetical protein